MPGDLELLQGAFVVAFDPIKAKRASEMGFAEIRLEPERFVGLRVRAALNSALGVEFR